jgi:Arm DNA-binding domain
MPLVTLTDLTVRTLKPVEGKRVTYLDKNLKGFGVMLMPSGHGSYVLTYGPSRQRVKLGDVGIVGLRDARDRAKSILANHQLGTDQHSTAPTWAAARDEFLKASAKKNKTRTTADYTRLLTRHFAPWDRLALDTLTPQTVQKRLDAIGAPSERKHAYDALKVFGNWAVRRHYLDHPLTARLDPPQKGKARRPSMKRSQKPSWGRWALSWLFAHRKRTRKNSNHILPLNATTRRWNNCRPTRPMLIRTSRLTASARRRF